MLNFYSQSHLFVIVAYKLIEYRKWASTFGLCATVDFSEIDAFSEEDVRDLRNMREHVVEYFQGRGHASSDGSQRRLISKRMPAALSAL